MLVHYFLPSPDLRPYVRLLQLMHFVFDKEAVLPHKPYWPRPEQCLAFYPRDTEMVEYIDGNLKIYKPRSAIIGQHSIVTNRYVGRHFLCFQVVFQPGVLHRLTGISSYEFTNTHIDAEAVFSKEIHLVNERLSSVDNYDEMTVIVENFLRNLVRRPHKDILAIDRVSELMLQNPLKSLEWLANEACLSTKQFYRKFSERTGISPKLYARIVRFDRAIRLKNTTFNKDWLSIAIESGYYDYQHLVKDYKEFTSLIPNAFHQADSQAPERFFGIVET